MCPDTLLLMHKGTITVENGIPTVVSGHGHSASPGDHRKLDDVLKELAGAGWFPEGDLPPHTTRGTYTIPIVKT